MVGGIAAIARGLRQDVREIVCDLMEPMIQRMSQLEKDLAIEREDRRNGTCVTAINGTTTIVAMGALGITASALNF